jgi:hypothetical protein
MKTLLFAALVSAGLLSTTADVSGDWTISGDVQGVTISETCSFTQTEAKLAGKCINTGKTFATTGTVEDKKVVFKHAGQYQGDPLTLTFTGIIGDDGNLSGAIYVDPLAVDGNFAAKKAAAKPAAGM